MSGAEGPPDLALLHGSRSATSLRRAQMVSSCVAVWPNPNLLDRPSQKGLGNVCVFVKCCETLQRRAIPRLLTEVILEEVGILLPEEA